MSRREYDLEDRLLEYAASIMLIKIFVTSIRTAGKSRVREIGVEGYEV